MLDLAQKQCFQKFHCMLELSEVYYNLWLLVSIPRHSDLISSWYDLGSRSFESPKVIPVCSKVWEPCQSKKRNLKTKQGGKSSDGQKNMTKMTLFWEVGRLLHWVTSDSSFLQSASGILEGSDLIFAENETLMINQIATYHLGLDLSFQLRNLATQMYQMYHPCDHLGGEEMCLRKPL